MKKLVLLMIPVMMMTGCKKADTSGLKIITPTGAPAFAFYKHADNPNFETNSKPINIASSLAESSDKDIVVIDTVTGVKAINNGAPYKLAASITFGNFFIASTGHDTDGSMDPGDKIVLFGKTQTPDLLFHYLYGNDYESGVEFVDNVQDAAKCLITGKNTDPTTHDVDYVFIAQPALYNALQKNANASKFIDIQEAYKTKSGGKSLIQASIFVRNYTAKDKINQFLSDTKKDIESAVNNPEVIKEALQSKDSDEMTSLYGVDYNVAVTVLKEGNGLGLGYKKGKDIKENIDAFISLFSVPTTDEKIYY